MQRVCNFCGNKNFTEKKTLYIYRRTDNFLMVNDVPWEQCDYCGEQYFHAKVLNKIEREFNAIYAEGREPQRRINVPVEDFGDLNE